MVRTKPPRTLLTADEREGIVLAVNSAFRKLKNLYAKVVPIFEDFGFTPPSAGVIARDLSEKIEKAIIQHCESFTKGDGHCDLCRFGQDWEVKICKDSGLTINQSNFRRTGRMGAVRFGASRQVTEGRRGSRVFRNARPRAGEAAFQPMESVQGRPFQGTSSRPGADLTAAFQGWGPPA